MNLKDFLFNLVSTSLNISGDLFCLFVCVFVYLFYCLVLVTQSSSSIQRSCLEFNQLVENLCLDLSFFLLVTFGGTLLCNRSVENHVKHGNCCKEKRSCFVLKRVAAVNV